MDDGRHVRIPRATDPNSVDRNTSGIFSRRLFAYLSQRPRRPVETVEPYSVGSAVGSVRSKNEDATAIVRARYSDHPSRSFNLALVCDGMGGMADGRHAALLAASVFSGYMLTGNRHEFPTQRLTKALQLAQTAVLRDLGGEGGTTLSAVYIDQSGQGWVVHVGDSRVYGVTSDGALQQLTRDDTLGAMLNRESEKRADFGRLVQFVGIDGELEPQLSPLNVRDFKGFVITSDGAHGAPHDVLSTLSQNAKSGGDLVRKLLNLADALGGVDNASAAFLPSSFQSEPANSDHDDLAVSFLCPSGDHDIWVSGLKLDANGRPSPQPGLQESTSTRVITRLPKDPEKKKRSKRRAKAKANELPLEELSPVAKVDFSD